MKKIRRVLTLLIILGFISTLVGGVGDVFGNPDGVTDDFDNENYIASRPNLVVSGGQVKLSEFLPSDYCATHNGIYTSGGDNVFCADGYMWSTTLASGQNKSGASSACSNLTHAGYSDWYLPSRNPLVGVCGDILCNNCGSWDPYCCSSSASYREYYWTSQNYSSSRSYCVKFTSCYSGSASNSFSLSVRCVRP